MENTCVVEPDFWSKKERWMKQIWKDNFLAQARHIVYRRAVSFFALLPRDDNDAAQLQLRARNNAALSVCRQRLLIVPEWN